jgi:glycerophosphoryl diester phosphodiesterase
VTLRGKLGLRHIESYLHKVMTNMIQRLLLTSTAILLIMNPLQPGKAATPPLPSERLLSEDRVLVIAHRGYSMLAPENTLPAFRFAMIAGADLVELDYHHSKDGIPIVIHDETADRTTDAAKRWEEKQVRVSSRNASELQTLDAGAWFSPAPFSGVGLPLLSEALDVIQRGSVTLIERKAGDAATCVALLRERNLVNHVVVQSFDWGFLKDFHKLEPRQILGALGPPGSYEGKKLSDEEKVLNSNWIHGVRQTGARVLVWNQQVTRESVLQAQQNGLKVWVYTINEPATATRLLDLGIDGIITDNPSVIWRTIALR